MVGGGVADSSSRQLHLVGDLVGEISFAGDSSSYRGFELEDGILEIEPVGLTGDNDDDSLASAELDD